jgi:hypothetical protein
MSDVSGPAEAAETGARQRPFAKHHGDDGCSPKGLIAWPNIGGP